MIHKCPKDRMTLLIFQNNLLSSGFGEGYPKLDLLFQRRELSFG